ncbi:MAG: hypothetical protein M1814_006889 [Vezdaea aestivalis]|nr:MAG: hypothetical protein M1814_006889 [Vezdaea aestivalis]
MAAIPKEKFALLVGVNLYNVNNKYIQGKTNRWNNLKGCINDVQAISQCLRSELHFDKSNIVTLKADRGWKEPRDKRKVPTRENLLAELELLEQKPPGALIYFHYSGHGNRQLMKHRQNGDRPYTETLVTWADELADYDLGNMLERLAKKHVVCAVLDCCHSGGADRESVVDEDETSIRSRSLYKDEANDSDSDLHLKDFPESEYDGYRDSQNDVGRARDAVTRYSKLGRARGYNLFTAVLPSELAKEHQYYSPLGRRTQHGVFTFHFLESLMQLRRSANGVTYGHLHDVVKAKIDKVSEKDPRMNQQPDHKGDENRFLFSSGASPYVKPPKTFLANVIEHSFSSMVINRGSAHGVSVSDRFLIYPPESIAFGQNLTGINPQSLEVKVTKADELRSEATWGVGHRPTALKGYFAQLIEHTDKMKIDVHLSVTAPKEVDVLLNECEKYQNLSLPIDMKFFSSIADQRSDSDFLVILKQNLLLNRQAVSQASIRSPSTPGIGPDDPRQLMELLHHLCSYQLAANLTPSNSVSPSLPYKFEWNEISVDKNDAEKGTISSWKLSFENRHKGAVQITVLNLGPAYGIHSTVHGPQENCVSVDPWEEESWTVDIVMPEFTEQERRKSSHSLRKTEMQDVFKLLLTEKSTDFRHYLIPNLQVDHDKVEIVRRKSGNLRVVHRDCIVEDKVVITQLSNGSP